MKQLNETSKTAVCWCIRSQRTCYVIIYHDTLWACRSAILETFCQISSHIGVSPAQDLFKWGSAAKHINLRLLDMKSRTTGIKTQWCQSPVQIWLLIIINYSRETQLRWCSFKMCPVDGGHGPHNIKQCWWLMRFVKWCFQSWGDLYLFDTLYTLHL